jgi:predicted NBD/HSP70 family sugar kinase
MEHYVGLDVSLKLTAICIVDQTGKIVREGTVASNPETIAAFVRSQNIEFSLEGEVSRPCRGVAMARSSLVLQCPHGKPRFTH